MNQSTPGGAFTYEFSVLHYALTGWRRASAVGNDEFTCHRAGGYMGLVVGVSFAVVIETLALHLLVQLWSPVAAWTLSSLGAYALIWMIGDTHAVRHRRIRISRETLYVRLGLRFTADVPIEAIERIEAVHEKLPRREGYSRAVLLGAPNRRIELNREVETRGLYGLPRRIRTLDLQIDEPERFDARMRELRLTK